MFVLSTNGHRGDVTLTPRDQAWHSRIVTRLLNSSKGDLMLDGHGNLCTRITWADGGMRDLAWKDHQPGEILALIGSDGWVLLFAGAQYILENSIFDKRDLRKLEAITR
jgi:hypothetical protein